MPLIDMAGQRFGEYAVIEHVPKRGWLCRCSCGVETVIPAWQLRKEPPQRCRACALALRDYAERGRLRRQAHDATLTYIGAHDRVKRDFGSASQFVCACGARARHWAYQYTDPDERTDSLGRRYSIHPKHYTAMCQSCHIRFDKEH